MNEQETRKEVFNLLTKELAFLDNNYDRLVYPNIKESVISDLKRFHGLEPDAKIIYYREISPDKSDLIRLVISDIGISYKRAYKVFFIVTADWAGWDDTIKWEDINRVEYSEDNKSFYFYGSEGYDEFCHFQRNVLIKKEDTSTCIKFAQILSQAAKLFLSPQELIKRIFELEKEEKFTEALSIINDLLNKKDAAEEAGPFLHYLKGRIISNSISEDEIDINDDRYDAARQELETALRNLGEDWKEYEDIICFYLSGIYATQGKYLQCRDCLIRAMNSTESWIATETKEAFEGCESQLEDFWKNYTNDIKYIDRQFIMPVKDIKGCYDELIKTFLISNIPPCIKFPIGHPIANELYIGHPYNSDFYIPYNNADETLFMDKVHELCYLLQCLGATEIAIQSIKGKGIREINREQVNFEASANYKMFSGGIDINTQTSSEEESNFNSHLELKQRFFPIRKPFVPEGLTWYPHEPKWQRLANSRLNGNLLEHSEFISTSDTHFISHSQEDELKLHLKMLIAKVNVTAQVSSSYELKQSTNTEWRINVIFKSINDLS